ncbi:hypothetical protein SS50377_27009 [Spironucleus salmonicida]|uniref:Uncharacterized protein n=1 Tax=Spironucleus salmonicida TaxID=348837 RepID=V6LUZ1_9EUKA|nr:hypothetical protein SS50377_27009 [Spironucleus salmonicida]|eukprot:EST47521.1 Hypothetical protein SS50377_12505 [Spironucleus salmonicida]
MKILKVRISNNKVCDIFTDKIGSKSIKAYNLPIFASQILLNQIFSHFGPVKSIDFNETEDIPDLSPFYPRPPKFATITLTAQSLLQYESYINDVIFVSKKFIPDVTNYLMTAYTLPTFPISLVNNMLSFIEPRNKPETMVTEKEIRISLNREKSYKFYKFQATEARQASVVQLRKNEEQMKHIIQEQKNWGWLGQ